MTEKRFPHIDVYICAPFNTMAYLNMDQMRFQGLNSYLEPLVEKLNRRNFRVQLSQSNLSLEWAVERSSGLKTAKGVFESGGRESSFVQAQIVDTRGQLADLKINAPVTELFPAGTLAFSNIRFYFYPIGNATCSTRVRLERDKGLNSLEMDTVSEELNKIYREMLADVCFQLTHIFVHTIREIDIPRYEFDFMPEPDRLGTTFHCLPWTHRIYHIHDETLFSLENPGEIFRFLLTPSRQMDVRDSSIYDNRYIYFGWGQSIMLTRDFESGYSQTNTPVYSYVRLVEIAQSNWQCLNISSELVNLKLGLSAEEDIDDNMTQLKHSVNEMQRFRVALSRLLDSFKDARITFDTEKRSLLDELNERWLTDAYIERLEKRLSDTEEMLNELFQQRVEKRNETLNVIVLIFTVLSLVEVLNTILNILEPVFTLSPLEQLALMAAITLGASAGLIYLLYRVQH